MSWRPNRLQRRLGIKPDPLRLNQPSQPSPPLATEAESEFDVAISFLNEAIEPVVVEEPAPAPEPVVEEPAPAPEPEPVVEEPAPAPNLSLIHISEPTRPY